MAFYVTKAGQYRAEAKRAAKLLAEIKREESIPAPSKAEVRASSTLRRLEMERDLASYGRYVVYSGLTKLPVDGFQSLGDALEYLMSLPKGSYIWDKVGRRKI